MNRRRYWLPIGPSIKAAIFSVLRSTRTRPPCFGCESDAADTYATVYTRSARCPSLSAAWSILTVRYLSRKATAAGRAWSSCRANRFWECSRFQLRWASFEEDLRGLYTLDSVFTGRTATGVKIGHYGFISFSDGKDDRCL